MSSVDRTATGCWAPCCGEFACAIVLEMTDADGSKLSADGLLACNFGFSIGGDDCDVIDGSGLLCLNDNKMKNYGIK